MKFRLLLLAFLLLNLQVFSNQVDSYGGYLNIKGEATGRFHIEKIEDRFFLVTPKGNGFISLGVTHTGSMLRGKLEKFDLFKAKFKNNFSEANTSIANQLLSWGYNTLGYDSNLRTPKKMPFMGSCIPTKNSLWKSNNDFQFDDIFSQTWKNKAKKMIEKMVREAKQKDLLIGYYWTDMPAWKLDHAKRRHKMHWVDYIRSLPENAPGKIRYREFLKENNGIEDDQKFLIIIAKEYYKFLGELTKSLDPDALIFGERYPGVALDFDVIKEALPYIDVISVQPGDHTFPRKDFDHLHNLSGKPIIICDHQCSFPTEHHPKTMWKQFKTVEEVNRAHHKYFEDAFATSYMIGYHRCQYIDRMKGNVLKQGLINAHGKPYSELTKNVKECNHRVHDMFLNSNKY